MSTGSTRVSCQRGASSELSIFQAIRGPDPTLPMACREIFTRWRRFEQGPPCIPHRKLFQHLFARFRVDSIIFPLHAPVTRCFSVFFSWHRSCCSSFTEDGDAERSVGPSSRVKKEFPIHRGWNLEGPNRPHVSAARRTPLSQETRESRMRVGPHGTEGSASKPWIRAPPGSGVTARPRRDRNKTTKPTDFGRVRP